MKRLFFLSLAFACITIGASAATITLSGPSSTSGSFDVDVDASNVFANFPGEAVTGFGFNVTIGSPVVMLTGVTVNGTFFDDFSGCCAGTDIVGLTNSTFILGVSAGDFTEPLLLATLHFSTIGSGTTTIGVTADSSNPDQGLYFLSGSESFSASQRVDAVSPEPATTLMVGLGTLVLLVLGRSNSAIARRL
jgi:hypothetical protein